MATYKQDLPPKGGYQPFEYAKKVAPRWMKGHWMIIGWAAASITMYKIHIYCYHKYTREAQLLNREANTALEPFMMAERNRMFLKRCIDNREYEKKVMKDVPGWIPGTYYGSPIYHQKDVWQDPAAEEYWAHSDYYKGYYNQQMVRLKH